jgi:hypothetical protein
MQILVCYTDTRSSSPARLKIHTGCDWGLR